METYDAHKTTTEVRQASRWLDNFWVLIISVASVVALFGILLLVFYVNTPVTAISP